MNCLVQLFSADRLADVIINVVGGTIVVLSGILIGRWIKCRKEARQRTERVLEVIERVAGVAEKLAKMPRSRLKRMAAVQAMQSQVTVFAAYESIVFQESIFFLAYASVLLLLALLSSQYSSSTVNQFFTGASATIALVFCILAMIGRRTVNRIAAREDKFSKPLLLLGPDLILDLAEDEAKKSKTDVGAPSDK